MTVDEKRTALSKFCDHTTCSACDLNYPMCRCSRGYLFLANPGTEHFITDAEIIAAYDIAFPEQLSGDATELCEIAMPEKVIINGKVKYLTINFFTQEE